jgi:hypothetical protein
MSINVPSTSEPFWAREGQKALTRRQALRTLLFVHGPSLVSAPEKCGPMAGISAGLGHLHVD